MKKSMRNGCLTAAALLAAAQASYGQTFFTESFDSAVRNQTASDPACPTVGVWTQNFPAGWLRNDCGVASFFCRTGGCTPLPNVFDCSNCAPDAGVNEWEGWSIASGSFWTTAAGNQRRAEFFNTDPLAGTLGFASGNVMIADADEWDDQGDPDTRCGYYNGLVTTPSISLAGADLSSLQLQFASSWRDEFGDDGLPRTNNQTAVVTAIYSNGTSDTRVEVLRYQSDPALPNFKNDAPNELVVLNAADLNAPVGSVSVRFEFALLNAGNDWWWAVDNIGFTANTGTLFAETFDAVPLGPAENEGVLACASGVCGPNAYTLTAPNAGSVSLLSPATGGTPDWRGWSFTSKDYWTCVSGNTPAKAFTLGDNLIAVADGQNFFESGAPSGRLNTIYSTPSINIAARTANLLAMTFDSSWFPAGSQTAQVTATFSPGGQTVTLINWSSDQLAVNFKAAAQSEIIGAPVSVPAGATSVVLSFNYEGGNEGYWAIDDVRLFQGQANIPVASTTPTTANMALALNIDYDACTLPWAPDAPAGWTELFDPRDGLGAPYCGATCGRDEWRGWSFPFREWWGSPSVDTQNREFFTKGLGRVAVADPDEWDDFDNGNAEFNAFLTSPTIPLTGTVNDLTLALDSSWRPEGADDATFNDGGIAVNNQTATIKAVYTTPGGPVTQDVLIYQSINTLPNFKPDAENESVLLDLDALGAPANATAVRFEFSMTRARNDWWWAFDNIRVRQNGASIFFENFDGAQGAAVPPTEGPSIGGCRYFSEVAVQPGGFTSTASNVNCLGPEFDGWGAWVVEAWNDLGGVRNQFLAPTAFISDYAAGNCDGTSNLLSPAYNIAGLNPNSLKVTFRSGWFSEAGHISTVDVSYDGGTTWLNRLTWNPANKTTATDEIVTVNLNNPGNATSAIIRFTDKDSGWWAITDIQVAGVIGQSPCIGDFNGSGNLTVQDIFDFLGAFFSSNFAADVNNSGSLTVQDVFDFLTSYFTGCP